MFPEVIILDGGLSSQLELHVTDKIDGDPLWTARFISTNSDAIVKTHLDYLKAGSNYIVTCTYQASVPGFMKHLNISETEALGLIKKAAELASLAIELYRKDYPDANLKIVGAIGPYGAVLNDGSEYTGNYADKISIEELIDWHKPRIQELINAGIEVFAFETIPCQKEAEALLTILSQYPNIKAWLSFSCQDKVSLVHGEKFQDVAVSCYNQNPQQILAVGANCLNPFNVHDLFSGINKDKETKIPLIVYPNSGEKYDGTAHCWIGENIPSLDTFVKDWLDLGVRYIGSCCRTTAKDITLIKKKVLEWQSEYKD